MTNGRQQSRREATATFRGAHTSNDNVGIEEANSFSGTRKIVEIEGATTKQLKSRVYDESDMTRTTMRDSDSKIVFSSNFDVSKIKTTTHWWCLCYRESINEIYQPVTNCRPTLHECQRLKYYAIRGSRQIEPNSLSSRCTAINGKYPYEELGSKMLWKPSQKKGSWWVPGKCLLQEQRSQKTM